MFLPSGSFRPNPLRVRLVATFGIRKELSSVVGLIQSGIFACLCSGARLSSLALSSSF